MALTNAPKQLTAGKLMGSQSEPSIHGVEKAAQTYKVGALLQDDDAGRITESASPVDGSVVTKRAIGLAVAAATGVTDADVHMVSLVVDGVILEATLSDATAGTHALARADQWQTYPLTKDVTSGFWYLDANAKSADGAVVLEFKDVVGTVDARVYCKITRKAIGGAHAASTAW